MLSLNWLKPAFLIIYLCFSLTAFSQNESYKSKLKNFRNQYISTHDVVKGDSVNYLKFFPIHEKYAVKATFTKLAVPVEFKMPTSAGKFKEALKIGYLHFTLKGKKLKLSVYQLKALLDSDQYKDYVFLPFTDLTSGTKSYGGGRYLDFTLADIKKGDFILDFNKAYNPSCIYADGFNCPIPPQENDLSISISAGEKLYALYKKNH
ncbi:DUF1684 domain-containing protein [Pedobacter cryophilus]|uniref:DUF1684 domain-containing protein n=1 Tax=Pedobacter cryophilus TaxID=2571271 RepID=A0A4U1C1I6_9SPHI|nr:DUF1684 domain-containing protein [Pedobacter cryophilus]TKB98837.1 DUF1684 domain-containing protein [Pedobacter cryophilus]